MQTPNVRGPRIRGAVRASTQLAASPLAHKSFESWRWFNVPICKQSNKRAYVSGNFSFVSVRYPSHDLFIILVKSIAKHCSFLAWWAWKEEFIRIFGLVFGPYGLFGGGISTMNRIDLEFINETESITRFNYRYILYYVALLWFCLSNLALWHWVTPLLLFVSVNTVIRMAVIS